jgi:signal transduction histidine kinase
MTTPPRPDRPPRGARVWGTLWRMLLALVIGAVLFLFGYGQAFDSIDPTGPESLELGGRLVIDVLLGFVAIGLLPLRRRAPLPVVLLIIALSAFSALAAGAAALAVVSLSTRRRWPQMVLATALFAAASVFFDFSMPASEPTPAWQLVVFAAVASSILPITGMYIGGRRQLLATLREQADSARREQQAERDQARLSERARIAREMHDVLAHRLSLVALHAGVLESRPDLSDDQRTTTAGIVRENAHLALGELRDVLGVLHDPTSADAEGQTHPQPTLKDLPELLRQSRLAGSPPTLEVDDVVAGSLDGLSEATSRHLYRFIQEGLTNARKHAPGQRVTVRIGGDPGSSVSLCLDNPITDSGSPSTGDPVISGRGLAGLRERATLSGGELTAGVTDDGRFEVSAWLPWT